MTEKDKKRLEELKDNLREGGYTSHTAYYKDYREASQLELELKEEKNGKKSL